MIDIITYKKEVKHVNLDNINLRRDSYLIDMYNPNLKEMKQISDITKVYMSDIKNCLDYEEIPRVENREHYILIIFRAVKENDKATTPFGVIVSKNFILLVHSENIKPFNEMVKNVDLKLFNSGQEAIVYKIFSDVMKDFVTNLESSEDDVDDLDKNVLKLQSQTLLNRMFTIKKSLIYYRKALLRNRDVLASLQNTPSPFLKKKGLFNPLVNESMQLIDVEELIKDRLATLLEVHLSNTSNKLNEIMKSFTFVASVLLLPLLISGIYGMNFRVIPLSQHEYGFWITIGMMVASIIITYAFFKKRQWI